jgi:hypothetical protein
MRLSKAGHLSSAVRQEGANLVQATRNLVRQQTYEIYLRAKYLSATEYVTLKQLADMGHPYAKRHQETRKLRQPAKATLGQLAIGFKDPNYKAKHQMPLPKPAYYINRHTGKFYRSWHWNLAVWWGGVQGTVWNAAPYSPYMLGTKKMILRPILEEAVQDAVKLRLGRAGMQQIIESLKQRRSS